MNNKEIIQALKENLAKFGSMKGSRVELAREIGPKQFLRLNSVGMWVDNVTGFISDDIYRLRPDYNPEPELIECEVKQHGDHLYFRKGDSSLSLHQAQDEADFIGFKYEDEDIIAIAPRLLKVKEHQSYNDTVLGQNFHNYEVLTPTHVLFKRGE